MRGREREEQALVFPTHVGVNLEPRLVKLIIMSFPHTRGGEPEVIAQQRGESPFSPHTWG